MRLDEIIKKLGSGGIPAWAIVGAGIILLLIAMKVAKGFLRFVFVVLALALFAGVVCWHLHNQGRI